MKYILPILLLVTITYQTQAQSKTTAYLENEYDHSLKIALYYSTLKVIAQQGSDSYVDLIRDIEKVIILRYDEISDETNRSFFEDINERILGEGYEELLNLKDKELITSLYIKERGNQVKGFFLIMIEDGSINCIDVKGYVPLDKIGELMEKVDFSNLEGIF